MLKYYLILNISFPTTDEEVRKAYLDLVKRFSPERHPQAFSQISEAYEALKDETSRIHTQLKSFLQVNMPEEEIAEWRRLKKRFRGPMKFAELMELEKNTEKT